MASYVVDSAAIFFKKIVVVTTIVVLIMSIDYADTIKRFLPGGSPQSGLGEFFALPVLTCAGMMWMSSAIDFILIFVSLELVTISFYVLVAYMRRNAASLEAGVKYLILSALSTGFTVYGITWIYGVTRQTNLIQIEQVLPSIPLDNQPGLLFGALLVLVGLGFKIAAAPFQFWVPDVYQGAPTPITAFLSVGSKSVGFIVLLRVVASVSESSRCRKQIDHSDHPPGSRHLALRQSRGVASDELQASSGLFQHRSCRLPPDRGGGDRGAGIPG